MVEVKEEEIKKEERVVKEAAPPPKKPIIKAPPAPKKIIKRRRKPRSALFYIILDILLIIFALITFEHLGIFSVRDFLFPKLANIPGLSYLFPRPVEDPYLLLKEERAKYEMALEAEAIALRDKENILKEKEKELIAREAEIEKLRTNLMMREKKIQAEYDRYKDYNENIKLQAKYIIGMPPAKAVERLNNMDDLMIIDILRAIEREAEEAGKPSMVPYLLTLMDPVRASTIQQKMAEGD